MAFVFNVVLLTVMLGLASLVLLLHLRLRAFGAEAVRVPALADELTRAITTSRTAMSELARTARTDGVKLEEATTAAERTLQDLIYVLDRAEKILTQFDSHLAAHPVPKTAPMSTAQQRSEPVSEPIVTAAAPEPTPAEQPDLATATLKNAAIMPGRPARPAWRRLDDAPEAVETAKFKPMSASGAGAAYQAATQAERRADVAPAVTISHSAAQTDAERELRRALEGAV